jgi:hypothetical protein
MKINIPLLALLVLGACVSVRAQHPAQLPGEEVTGQLAKGHVFHDANDNRLMDPDEEGIAGVLVSNGTALVKTNEAGAYEIPVSDDAIIFVVKPKDWIPPVNADNLPQFYYLHKPNGSPANFTYAGVAPTGALPDAINFPLYPEGESNAFTMVVFGDPQPYNIEQIDFLSEDIIVELLGRDDLEFGITMGDIVGDDLSLFSPLNQAVAQIGIPWYNVLGNHDINYRAPTDELSNETYSGVYGPATFAFVYGDVHFIVVDDVIHESKAGSRDYVGGLRPDQLTFVANYLETVATDQLVVLAMHIPLAQHGKTFRQSDQKKLFDLLKPFPHTLSISAHTHVHDNQFYHEGSSDWKQPTPHHHYNVGTTSGSWWNGMRSETDVPHTMMRDGTPNGYSFISFKGTEYIIDWKVAGSPESHKMNIHVPRGIVAGSDDTTRLTVNFFNGSEQSVLEYRIKGLSDWQQMEKVMKFDPYYLMIKARWQGFDRIEAEELWEIETSIETPFPGSNMPNARRSTHLWEADLGTDWPAGRHVIEVRAKDRYGRVFMGYHSMRVVDAQ